MFEQKNALAILAGTLTVVVIAILLYIAPPEVMTYASTLGSIVLVAITALYVRFTWNLVEAQRETLRQAEIFERKRLDNRIATLHRVAMAELWKISQKVVGLLNGTFYDIRVVFDCIRNPHDTSLGYQLEELRKSSMLLREASQEMVVHNTEVPDEFHEQSWDAAAQLVRISNLLLDFHSCVLSCQLDSEGMSQKLTLEAVKERWEINSKNEVAWTYMVSGKATQEAIEAFNRLGDEAYFYARNQLSK